MRSEIVEGFVTVKDACEQLGVCANTLRSWGATGKIEEYRHPLNNYRLYRRSDVEALRALLSKPLKASVETQKGKHAT